MIKVLSIDCCLISESWDRENGMKEKLKDKERKEEKNAESLLQIEGYKVIKNVLQREERGGKPILLINTKKFFITELCPNLITVPSGLEVTWALLTPKCQVQNSSLNHIIVAAMYYTEKTN